MNETAQASLDVKIVNKRGLHARASAKFVQMAEKFPDVQITVSKGNEAVGGLSIMGLMLLAPGPAHSEYHRQRPLRTRSFSGAEKIGRGAVWGGGVNGIDYAMAYKTFLQRNATWFFIYAAFTCLIFLFFFFGTHSSLGLEINCYLWSDEAIRANYCGDGFHQLLLHKIVHAPLKTVFVITITGLFCGTFSSWFW